MEALIIKSKDPADLKLIKELAGRMGLESQSIPEEQLEDLGLTLLMKEADCAKTVSRKSVMVILQA